MGPPPTIAADTMPCASSPRVSGVIAPALLAYNVESNGTLVTRWTALLFSIVTAIAVTHLAALDRFMARVEAHFTEQSTAYVELDARPIGTGGKSE
jgi:hypothetical protein